jgi:hypothetical protein
MSRWKLTLLAAFLVCLLGLSPATGKVVSALTPTPSSTDFAQTNTNTPTATPTGSPTLPFTPTRTPTTSTRTITPTRESSGCLIVDNLNDPGQCSLRDVIASVPEGGTVTFAPGLTGRISLSSSEGQIVIDKNIIIDGPATGRISVESPGWPAPRFRVFSIRPNRRVSISRLSIGNGRISDSFGGNINVASGATLILRDTSIYNGQVFVSGLGGGIYNGGTLYLYNSTLHNNQIMDNMGSGGGIYNSGTAFIVNSTIASNKTIFSGGTGGIHNSGQLTLYNVTIANNHSESGGIGGLRSEGGSVTIVNTILANNTRIQSGNTLASNCSISGTITGTNNLESSTGAFDCPIAAGFSAGEARLTALGNFPPNNTYMIGLQLGSDAIDTGDPATCANAFVDNKDQRGVTRPFSTRCDIGAFEYDTPFATYTPSPTLSITNTPTDTPTSTNTPTPTNTPIPPRADTIGVYKDGAWYLRNSNTTGNADIFAVFGGDASDLPVVGDWNNDEVDTIGVYRGATGTFILSDSNTAPAANYVFTFGNPGDRPLRGRWSNTFTSDGVGVYRDSNGILYQKNALATGFDDNFAIFGNPSDQGVAGDWNNDGLDSIGVYRSSNYTWYLSNNNQPSGITFADLNFVWYISTDAPVTGDWNGDGITTPGYFNTEAIFVLINANASTNGGANFYYGMVGSLPVAGKWSASVQPPVAGMIIGNNQSGGANVEPGGDAD